MVLEIQQTILHLPQADWELSAKILQAVRGASVYLGEQCTILLHTG